MIERQVLEQFMAWKDKIGRKPLLVTGVRQCGKTYLIKNFGETEFENMAYFNFDGNKGLHSVFDYDFDIKRIIDELESVLYGKPIIPGKTLVVFDEIQDCKRAIQSLKYFCEEMPELHIIAAGSLLGVALKEEGVSFPVGKIDRVDMYPMSFEEFVRADGGGRFIDGLRKMPLDREIPELYKVPLEKYLKNYYIVGGMPEAVKVWVETHDYKEVEKVQDNIIKDYADDFSKHTTSEIAIKIRYIWDSVPSQIAKENNKFFFSHVKPGARSKELEDALDWLVNAGIVGKLCMISSPQIPLSGEADYTYFKVYMSDIGLLRKRSNLNYRTILEGDESYIRYKGAMAENYVYMQLKIMGIDSFFWRSKSGAELDFITDYEGVIVPIEVKSADNTKAKSLHQFCNRFSPKFAVKTSLKNVGDNMDGETHVWSIPLYELFRYKEYLYNEMGWVL